MICHTRDGSVHATTQFGFLDSPDSLTLSRQFSGVRSESCDGWQALEQSHSLSVCLCLSLSPPTSLILESHKCEGIGRSNTNSDDVRGPQS